jgi:hypothetical protein
VRLEIIREFQGMLTSELPQAEQGYYVAGLSGGGKCCEACSDKKQYCLAFNARFQSFLGFFDVQIQGDDTLTPLQREFVRLAQIFKARMITELQLKQRVMERSLIEERVRTNYLDELQRAKDAEDDAKRELLRFQFALNAAIAGAETSVAGLQTMLDTIENESHFMRQFVEQFVEEIRAEEKTPDAIATLEQTQSYYAQQKSAIIGGRSYRLPDWWVVRGPDPDFPGRDRDYYFITFSKAPEIQDRIKRLVEFLSRFSYLSESNNERFRRAVSLATIATTGNPATQILSGEQFLQLRADLAFLVNLIREENEAARRQVHAVLKLLREDPPDAVKAAAAYQLFRQDIRQKLKPGTPFETQGRTFLDRADAAFTALEAGSTQYKAARRKAELLRRPLDEKKLLDMLVDEMEDKFIEQLEGTRAHTANIDNYLKSLSTALEDDFNTQFYYPAFRKIRESSYYRDVTLGQVETTSVLANNRAFAKVDPAATFEFDLPKRSIMITEGFQAAKALMDEYGALMNDPTFLSLAKVYSGLPVSGQLGVGGGLSPVRNVLPGLPTSSDEMVMAQAGPGRKEFGAALEALIPDPAIYKFETGTGYEIRPVLSPDGQAVVFNFNYMYTTDVREPVRAGEKHLGRVKRHFVHTDVQLSNYELREVSTYRVALKASRTARGVPLLQDIPGVGALFRPLPSAESALQENLIYAQGTIFPTLFDLMGLRYAPAVAELDPLAEKNDEWVVRNRRRDLEQRIYDYGAAEVDKALRIPLWEQRTDLYRPQVTIPYVHPNGYYGPGLKLKDSHLREGTLDPYDVRRAFPETRFTPGSTIPAPPPPDPYLGPTRTVPAPNPAPVPTPGLGYLPPAVQSIPGPTTITPAPAAPPSYPQVPQLPAPPGTTWPASPVPSTPLPPPRIPPPSR